MKKKLQKKNIIAAIDIGTNKICAIISKYINNKIIIIGTATFPSLGLKKGIILNKKITTENIKKTLKLAELKSGYKIKSVFVNISGKEIYSFNDINEINLSININNNNLKKLIKTNKKININSNQKIIHFLPQKYIIKKNLFKTNSNISSTIILKNKSHIITAPKVSIYSIIKCINKAGLNVSDIIIESLASSEAILTKREKKLGVILIEIGSSTTDIIIFKKNNVKHSMVLNLGGNDLTNQIAIKLKSSFEKAEKIKKIFNFNKNNKKLSSLGLKKIIKSRIKEIFLVIQQKIFNLNIKNINFSKIVLSGGSSLIDGIIDISESVFGIKTRIGKPLKIDSSINKIKSPIYSTSIGLTIYGINKFKKNILKNNNKLKNIKKNVKKWFSN